MKNEIVMKCDCGTIMRNLGDWANYFECPNCGSRGACISGVEKDSQSINKNPQKDKSSVYDLGEKKMRLCSFCKQEYEAESLAVPCPKCGK
jgi:predicted RNA-binding Zn-ribbon protein involved in translation (DUF1610 family)